MDEVQDRSTMPSSQLVQERVPLSEAAEVFGRPDVNGVTPIIVTPLRSSRILNGPIVGALIAFASALFGGFVIGATWALIAGSALALILLGLGILRWFYIQIPEGVNALLSRGGRYVRTIGSGLHLLPPYLRISHLVTRREIPFDVPVTGARTRDNIRADIDALVTFSITNPSQFVYRISASDFDQFFQASCQEAVHALVRGVTSDDLSDLVRHDETDLSKQLNATVEPYGATVSAIIIVYVEPPADFVMSQEARQLAVLQREEQAEKQTLAERRQADADTLLRQQLLARMERERDELQARLLQIEARQEIVAHEANVEAERLARLEERLRAYPLAAQYEWESARLEVARALAGNTRAILQVGNADDIAHSLMMRDAFLDAALVARDTGLPPTQQDTGGPESAPVEDRTAAD